MNARSIYAIIVVGFVSVLLLPSATTALTCGEISTNAIVTNGNVHLRSSTPRFTFGTLVKFRLTQGPSLAVVKRGTRVEVLERREVARSYEWFRVRYCEGDTPYRGWIYAGRIGKRLYLKFDDPQNPVLGLSSPEAIDHTIHRQPVDVSGLLAGIAVAQPVDVVNEPEISTNPFLTVLLGFSYVSIFIGALLVTRKYIFPESALYSFLTSLSILLILGFLSSTEFSRLIAEVLAKVK